MVDKRREEFIDKCLVLAEDIKDRARWDVLRCFEIAVQIESHMESIDILAAIYDDLLEIKQKL